MACICIWQTHVRLEWRRWTRSTNYSPRNPKKECRGIYRYLEVYLAIVDYTEYNVSEHHKPQNHSRDRKDGKRTETAPSSLFHFRYYRLSLRGGNSLYMYTTQNPFQAPLLVAMTGTYSFPFPV